MGPSPPLLPRKCGGLVSKIHEGDCVLVLGPRVAMPRAIAGDDDTPIDDYLAGKLREDLTDTGPAGLRAAIAQYEQQPGGATALRSVVQQVVQELDGHTTDLHRNLASLPFRLVLQATPDTMMHTAFIEKGKAGAVQACYDYCGGRSSEVPLTLPTSAHPIVYSLFGRHDRPESMVLTDKNLLDYLVKITKESPPLPDPVRATLRAPASQFLFVGFGFTNWWLRLLLKVLDVTGVENRGLSLALEDSSSFETASQENKGFFESAGIFIQAGDWKALASALASRYQEDVEHRATQQPAAPTPGAAPASAPLVFLSYASEDADVVTEIRNRLQRRGVAVWQDVQNLRAGQNWETRIAECIRRVDYFVFIQSVNMDQRDGRRESGVYNRELKLALNRVNDMPADTVFVIHATIGACRTRPEPALASINRIRLDTEQGVDDLASAILESHAALPEGAGARARGLQQVV